MGKQLKTSELLRKLNNIPMQCSGIENNEYYDYESESKEKKIG